MGPEGMSSKQVGTWVLQEKGRDLPREAKFKALSTGCCWWSCRTGGVLRGSRCAEEAGMVLGGPPAGEEAKAWPGRMGNEPERGLPAAEYRAGPPLQVPGKQRKERDWVSGREGGEEVAGLWRLKHSSGEEEEDRQGGRLQEAHRERGGGKPGRHLDLAGDVALGKRGLVKLGV